MRISIFPILFFAIALAGQLAAQPAIGAAPKGDATEVASRIIKANFPSCERVSGATRLADGSIQATCDGTAYRVFTLFDPKSGELLEIAMNCDVAKKRLNISCYSA
jgi:hypothetical protein